MGRNTNKKCLNMRDETLAIKSNKNWWKIFIILTLLFIGLEIALLRFLK